MQKKPEKKFFLLEVNSSELAAWIVSVKKRILVTGSQCVKKQS